MNQKMKNGIPLIFNSAIGYYQLLSHDSTANSFRFYFSSPSHPPAAYEYHFETDELKIDSRANEHRSHLLLLYFYKANLGKEL